MKTLRLAVLLVVCCLSVREQPSAQAPDSMPITVLADRILIGAQFVPRYLDLSRVKVVVAGEIWSPNSLSTWDYIEVQAGGVLFCDRTRDTTLLFTHLFILPGGYLNCGSDGFIIADRKVDLVVRDVPINTARDPFQWGNGILNFGREDRIGGPKLAWTTLTQSVPAGASVITLSEDPAGWRVGDELLLPFSRHWLSREAPVFIAGIAGRVVTLSHPLAFDHDSVRKPDGTIVLTPRVGNLTRNLVVRSENPTGTPGHTASIGHDAIEHVADNELRGLGRTKNLPLDSTSADLSHIGTNQVARYADHYHHVMRGLGSFTRESVIRGTGANPGPKWGVVVHASHDIVIERNIAVDVAGAGFVTEDGYEVRNTFTQNLAAYILGNHDLTSLQMAGDNDTKKCPGCEGSGFWFRGMQNTFRGNEAWNSHIGFNVFAITQVTGLYPSVPGGMPDTPFDRLKALPLALDRTVTVGNRVNGFEEWGLPRFPVENVIAANNGSAQVFQSLSDPAVPTFANPILIAQDGDFAAGIKAASAYTSTLIVTGGYIGGNRIGIADGGANGYLGLTNVTLQNVVDVPLPRPAVTVRFENVKNLQLGTHPLNKGSFGTDVVWNGVLPPPDQGISRWMSQRGSQAFLINDQGVVGETYQLFHKQQIASLPAFPSQVEPPWNRWNCPDVGLTMGQCWAKYGMAYEGEALDDAVAVRLPGWTAGYARKTAASTLGSPRGIITLPTMRAPATLASDGNGSYLLVYGLTTGIADPQFIEMYATIDGGPAFLVAQRGFNDSRTFTVRTPSALTAGTHTIQTVRGGTGGTLQTSLLTFSYFIGAVTPPPPPPPPPAPTCQDPTAANVGGPLPCVFPPPPPPPPPPPVPQWRGITPTFKKLDGADRYQLCTDHCVEMPVVP